MSFEQAFPIGLIVSFTFFAIFRYFQATCLRDFQGLSGGKKTMLDVVSVFGLVFELSLLGYYAYVLYPAWYYAVALFAIAFVIKNALFWLAAKNKSGAVITAVAMLGFIGIPLSLLGVVYFFIDIYKGMGLDI